jgi:uncharacterized protein YukE
MHRNAYDTAASAQSQSDLAGVVSRLEALISQRNGDVNAAMADVHIDGASDEYRVVEQRWHSAATEVQSIITLVRTTLLRNDETATTTLGRARAAVQGIG